MCLTDEQVELLVRFRNHEPSVALGRLASTTDEASESLVKVDRRFFASLRTTNPTQASGPNPTASLAAKEA